MGKAQGTGDIYDFIKQGQHDQVNTYGLNRTGYQGTGEDRGTTTGSVRPDNTSLFKLDVRGGIMKGPLGRKSVASAELGASGIIDLADYHVPRLYITNTGGNTLKVLIPTMGDGQEIFIRSNGGATTPIQNTAGTGDETTGNIETMDASTYSMVGDDWLCFHYDSTDSKFHQITAGKQNIGGGGGTGDNLGNHTATQDLQMGAFDIDWGTNAKINVTGTSMFLFAGTTNTVRLATTVTSFLTDIRPNSDSSYDLGTSSNYWRRLYVDDITMNGDITLANNDVIFFGSNRIQSDSSGNLEYSVASSADDHEFFVGGVAQISIQSSGLTLFNALQGNNQNIDDLGNLKFGSTSAIGGSDVGWSGLTGDIYGNVQSNDSYFFRENGTTIAELDADGLDLRQGWLEMTEITPPSGLANHMRMYVDDSSGTTRLRVNINGTVTTLATG